MAYFKYGTTKQINIIRNIPGMRLWQRNFYEHIIRNDSDLNRIRQYITNNPANWENDKSR
jgi:REP element-mobilizing transposase RayT